MSETILDVAGLTRRFGTVVANDDVSLQVRAGDVVGLLGHNGAGKTTLVSQLVGCCDPTPGASGSARSTPWPTRLRRVGKTRLVFAAVFIGGARAVVAPVLVPAGHAEGGQNQYHSHRHCNYRSLFHA